MARVCSVCGKKPGSGRSIIRRGMAKSKGGVGQKITGNKLRRFNPNLQKINTVQETGNKRVLVCTKCIKAGKIRKP